MISFLKRKFKFGLFTLAVIVSLLFVFISQTLDREQLLAGVLLDSLKRYHFKFQNIDDKVSKKLFDSFFVLIEPSKMLFTKENIHLFKKYELLLDDEIRSQKFRFFQEIYPYVKKRITFIQEKYHKLLASPVDLFQKTNLEFDTKKQVFASNDVELTETWIKYLRYRLIVNYVVLLKKEKTQKNSKNLLSDEIFFQKHLNISSKDLIPELEILAREKLLATLDRYYNNILEKTASDYFVVFINAFLNTFDPHTEYFPPQAKADFEIVMTGKLEGIGALLESKDGFIRIVRIIPGSASWKQKELEVGDIILKIATGKKDPIDVVGLSLDKVVTFIRGKAGTKVGLIVQKSDGSIKTIKIIRDVVELEDSYAKSGVLQDGVSNKKIGYVQLNRFYRDFSDDKARHSSNDVRKEVLALKKQNVDGIILDLRNNGGGALEDAVEMSGLFIKNGPIVQIRDRDTFTKTLSDRDPAIVYSGPLVILINSYSASASEILAAALQDYKRAIIVGDKRTFGKGSVQVIVDIDRKVPFFYRHFKPLGSLKLTIQKFYRVTGDSTQFKGVESDIVLPSSLNYLDIGERFLETALSWSKIDITNFEKHEPYGLLMSSMLEHLKKENKKRVSESEYFSFIRTYETEIISLLNNNLFSLPLVMNKQNKIFIWNKNLKKIQDKLIQKNNISFLLNEKRLLLKYKSVKLGKVKLNEKKKWLSSLTEDFYIAESINILKDIANFTLKNKKKVIQ